jgi:poly(3-hydroxybutyrate) depolymerase
MDSIPLMDMRGDKELERFHQASKTTVAIGIGCKRGCSSEAIVALVERATRGGILRGCASEPFHARGQEERGGPRQCGKSATGHDVYITDWHNICAVPLAGGRFDFSAFVDHLVEFLRVMGAGSHVVAVCQPCVPVLAAAALTAEDGDPAQPRSMTLMAGPIDTRISPTKVNELALRRPINWFKRNLIAQVPQVYPGFMQLAAFLSMNLERHLRAFKDMVEARAADDQSKFQFIHAFYEEDFAVMDLPAEFYLETVKLVFQDHSLPLGKFKVHGRLVNPGAIRRTALLTVEGERDDICGLGQTLAAQDLCTGLRQYMKVHHVQTGVGHYGVFSGGRWNNEVYPMVRDIIQMTD